MAGSESIMCQVSQANTPTVQSATVALALNVNRSGWLIQNQGTNPLFVMFGSGISNTVFHVTLQGGTALNDGKGGIYSQLSGVVYQGIISTTGVTPTYTTAEFS